MLRHAFMLIGSALPFDSDPTVELTGSVLLLFGFSWIATGIPRERSRQRQELAPACPLCRVLPQA
ncbi:hypothetical protein [Nocardioides taihuensis]|uniref:Uncharacterized protein n=1 Tax=Nocardioides taihuensis TaxID=1835606 RepID=A0ABW0BMP9_9ACTN